MEVRFCRILDDVIRIPVKVKRSHSGVLYESIVRKFVLERFIYKSERYFERALLEAGRRGQM